MFGVKQSLIGNFRKIDDADQARALGVTNPFWLCDWDFTLSNAAA